MAGYIMHGQEKSVILRADEVDRVIATANGDVALLYLTLMKADHGISAESLMQSLRLTPLRFAAAETALQEIGVLSGQKTEPQPPEPKRVEYSAEELAVLWSEPEYQTLRKQVENVVNYPLSPEDDKILTNLYHEVGFPAEVIYQLVTHCAQTVLRRYGPGRLVRMRYVEKEGYYWARMGICDLDSAARYLREYDSKLSRTAAYMSAMQMGIRPPVESEQQYILSWIDMGFTPEAVALAYDRTVLRKQGMDWRYLNGILRRWHGEGWHTRSEVEQGEKAHGEKRASKQDDDSWMNDYT